MRPEFRHFAREPGETSRALARFLPDGLVGKARIAEAGADGEHRPLRHVAHERSLAEPLDHSVVVHQHDCLLAADLRYPFLDPGSQPKSLRLPISGQVLRAAPDSAAFVHQAGHGDADERRQLELLPLRLRHKPRDHVAETIDGLVAPGLVLGVAPQLRFPHPRRREIVRLPQAEIDDAAAEIGAAEVDADDAVVAGKDPRRRKMCAADQPRLVRMVADRLQLHAGAAALQYDRSAAGDDLADPAFAHAAADGDAFHVLPALAPGEAADDRDQPLRELLRGPLDQAGGFRLALAERLVEALAADLLRRPAAQRIISGLADLLPQLVDQG